MLWINSDKKIVIPHYVHNMACTIAGFQIFCYYGTKLLNTGREHYNVETVIDKAIPLIPWTVIIYIAAFLFWAAYYLCILSSDLESARTLTIADLISKAICFVIFLAVPTEMVRPDFQVTGAATWVLKTVYAIDTPRNLFPSIHCSMSWMCFIAINNNKNASKRLKLFTLLASAAICLSTMTVKQHVFLDVISGIGVAYISYYIAVLILKKDNKDNKKENKAALSN